MSARVSLRLYSDSEQPNHVTALLGEGTTEEAGIDKTSGKRHSSRWTNSWEEADAGRVGELVRRCDEFVASHLASLERLRGQGWKVDIMVNVRLTDGSAIFQITPAVLDGIGRAGLNVNFLVLTETDQS
jgi:hypothetical protein